MARKTKKQMYEGMHWFHRARYDSLSSEANHWEQSARITDSAERRALYRKYAGEIKQEMKAIITLWG